METDPGLEFEFYLASKLSMTRARLREEMSNGEFVQWGIYYARIAQQAELNALTGGAT